MESTRFKYSRMLAGLNLSVAPCFSPLRFAILLNPLQELLGRFKRTPLGFGEFEFRWHKLTTKCLGKNGLSNAVYSLSSLHKSRFNPIGECEQSLDSADNLFLFRQRGKRDG